MPAQPMPHIQAEIRPQAAVTSASNFQAKSEASTEAAILSGRGRCGLWPPPCLGMQRGTWEMSRAANCSEILNGQRQALATTVGEGGSRIWI